MSQSNDPCFRKSPDFKTYMNCLHKVECALMWEHIKRVTLAAPCSDTVQMSAPFVFQGQLTQILFRKAGKFTARGHPIIQVYRVTQSDGETRKFVKEIGTHLVAMVIGGVLTSAGAWLVTHRHDIVTFFLGG